jgi:hypothetical protein
MSNKPPASSHVRDICPGLWIWQLEHPLWRPGQGWDPVVACTCVDTGGERLVIDPLDPGTEQSDVWTRLDRVPPTAVVILKPDHVRDVDSFVERYGVPAYGPDRFDRADIPETQLRPIYPGSELPGGARALDDGRWRNETPLWLPEHRAIVFADSLTAPHGELLIWGSPWHEQRALPALRDLLELPFEYVIVSHGEPLHRREDFERALRRQPWTG